MRIMHQRNYRRYTDEQVDRANCANIYELAKYRGYEVRDKSPRLAEIRHQSGLDLDRVHNKWYCHGARQGGGPIQLLMYMENFTWLEAVQNILNEDGEIEVFQPREEIREEKTKKDFKLPDKNNTYKHIFAYLVKSRFIHPAIVNTFVKEHLLYENDKKSCVFVGMDKNKVARYAAIRGTNTIGNVFKGEASGSNKSFGFCREGSNNILTVVEAPIDLLSYMTIYKLHGLENMIAKEHLLSLGCTADNALEQYLFDHPEVDTIQLGLDNDAAGNDGCQKIFEKYSPNYHIKRIHMKEKDFNEVLEADMKRMAKKQLEQIKTCEEEEQLESGD